MMKRLVAIGICLAVVFCGCASSRLRSSSLFLPDDKSLSLRRNMSPYEVVELMGNPQKPILIYFYANEAGGLRSSFSKDKCTPLVFVDNKLAGWGWDYLHGAAKGMISN